MNRRNFLRAAVLTAPIAATCYGFAEAGALQIARVRHRLPNLPPNFDGLRIAFLTDLHHGPYVNLEYVRTVVRTTQALQPDLILLGGDYSLREAKYIGPAFEVLAGLAAPLGVYGVLGNHDYWHGLRETKDGMKAAGITELTNAGLWFSRGTQRLRLGGVDDLWEGRPNVQDALGDATATDATLLVSHNPDYAETLLDRRVGLMLSGHTHGGQAQGFGLVNPFTPSRYGNKYASGLVEAPAVTVYVSRGLGLSGLPVRFNCTPELTLLTLTA